MPEWCQKKITRTLNHRLTSTHFPEISQHARKSDNKLKRKERKKCRNVGKGGERKKLTEKSNRVTGTSGDEKNPTNRTGNLTGSLLCHFLCSQYAFFNLPPLKDERNVRKQKLTEIFSGYYTSVAV
jgi:hypothetical protein